MSDPRLAQRQAADPKASIFVTANAGSGKTTTLVDRVARLLLGEAGVAHSPSSSAAAHSPTRARWS